MPAWTIDDFLASEKVGPISFVKMDVQGMEWPVLLGMKKTLAENPGITLAAEFAPLCFREMGFEPTEFLEFFRLQGMQRYELFRNGQLEPVDDAKLLSLDGPTGYTELIFRRSPLPA